MKKLYAILLSCMVAPPLWAKNFTINMWTISPSGGINVFEPSFIKIQKNDRITFVQKQKWHNSESIDNATPKGVNKWRSKLGKGIAILFEKEGIYGYKCTPHISAGMVGIIQVGKPVNLKSFTKNLNTTVLKNIKSSPAKHKIRDMVNAVK